MYIIRKSYECYRLNIWIVYDIFVKNSAKVRKIFEMCKRKVRIWLKCGRIVDEKWVKKHEDNG